VLVTMGAFRAELCHPMKDHLIQKMVGPHEIAAAPDRKIHENSTIRFEKLIRFKKIQNATTGPTRRTPFPRSLKQGWLQL
jgi:hypothetical protein